MAEFIEFVRRLGRWAQFVEEMCQGVRENAGNGCSVWRDADAVIEVYDDEGEFATFTPAERKQIKADINGWLTRGKQAEAAGDPTP